MLTSNDCPKRDKKEKPCYHNAVPHVVSSERKVSAVTSTRRHTAMAQRKANGPERWGTSQKSYLTLYGSLSGLCRIGAKSVPVRQPLLVSGQRRVAWADFRGR